MSDATGFNLEAKYAVTMWDFSWLVRRTGDEAEYADWDKILDELADAATTVSAWMPSHI